MTLTRIYYRHVNGTKMENEIREKSWKSREYLYHEEINREHKASWCRKILRTSKCRQTGKTVGNNWIEYRTCWRKMMKNATIVIYLISFLAVVQYVANGTLRLALSQQQYHKQNLLNYRAEKHYQHENICHGLYDDCIAWIRDETVFILLFLRMYFPTWCTATPKLLWRGIITHNYYKQQSEFDPLVLKVELKESRFLKISYTFKLSPEFITSSMNIVQYLHKHIFSIDLSNTFWH